MPGRSRMSRFGAIFLGAVVLLVPNGVFGADLSGIVQTHDGAPAGAGWRVVVNGLDVPGATVALTDESGSFQLIGLGDGRSTVTVLAPPEEGTVSDPRAGRLVRLQGNRPTRLELRLNPVETSAPTFNFTFYRGEYWNDQPSEALSTGIQLLEQGAIGTIDMELTPGGGTISGRVLRDVGGTGIEGLVVAAFGSGTSIFSFDRTDSDGYYRITGIPADGFIVTAGLSFSDPLGTHVGEYFNNSLTIATSSMVTVSEGSDTPDIDFSLGEGGGISGRITAEAGGKGLGSVLLIAYEVTLDLQQITLTDDDGYFLMNRLEPGTWKLGASSSGNFAGEFWNDKERFDTADLIVVPAGPPVMNINMSLATGGTIAGLISHQTSGLPVADLLVLAERTGDHLTRTARTNLQGSYEILGLPSGMYQVYVPEIGKYWNNRVSPETADLVSVSLAEISGNIDFQGLPLSSSCLSNPEDVSTIRGAVIDQAQNPISGASLSLYVDVLGTQFQVDESESDAGGHYEFNCVQPGTYSIECRVPFSTFLTEWYDDQSETRPDTIRAVANQVTDNIDFALTVGGTIGGRVTAAGGMPLPGVEVIVKNRTTGGIAAEMTAADGRYSVSGGLDGGLPAGTYTVWTEGRSTADPSLVPVVLSRFDASASATGGVVLAWTTSHEFHHAGFHVERAAAPDAAPVRLTNELLSGGPKYRYVDAGAPDGSNWYWLLAVDRHGRSERLGPVAIDAGPVVGSRLLGPLVNPSVRTASIRWQTAREGRVQLRLFDAAGRWVRTLVDEVRPAGAGAAHWDGRSADGRDVAGGLYFLRFDTEDETQTGRLMLVR